MTLILPPLCFLYYYLNWWSLLLPVRASECYCSLPGERVWSCDRLDREVQRARDRKHNNRVGFLNIYYSPEVRRGKYWGLGVFLLQYFPLVKI